MNYLVSPGEPVFDYLFKPWYHIKRTCLAFTDRVGTTNNEMREGRHLMLLSNFKLQKKREV